MRLLRVLGLVDLITAHLPNINPNERILEIGATTTLNLGGLFKQSKYESISIEEGQTYRGNFMNLQAKPYGYIFSLNVFEPFGIDRGFHSKPIESDYLYTNKQRLAKLSDLTNSGGINMHITSGLPVIFENQEIHNAGFRIIQRKSKFESEIKETNPRYDYSEILVLHKK